MRNEMSQHPLLSAHQEKPFGR